MSLPHRRAVGIGADRRSRANTASSVLHGAIARREVELAVLRGAAELVNDAGAHAAARRRARLRARRRGAVLRLRLQLRVVGRVRSLVGGAARSAARRVGAVPARGGAALRVRRSISTAPGTTTRPTATSGIPRVARRLASVLPRPLGHVSGRTAGRGSAPIPGPGRRITTAAGDSRPARGSGFPGRRWAPAWVSWALRARLRELVSARLEQPPGPAVRECARLRLRPVARLDRGAARPLRSCGYVHVAPHTVYSVTVHGFVTRPRRRPRFAATPFPACPRRFRVAGTPRRAARRIRRSIRILEPGGARVAPGGSRTMVGPARSGAIAARAGGRLLTLGRPCGRGSARIGRRDERPRLIVPRPGIPTRRDPSGSVSTPFSARSNSIVRNVAPGAATSGTAVRRGDGGVAEPGSIRADGGRTPVAPTSRIQPADGARASTAPYPYPQYGAQPRATPRDNPAYRPMPPPGSANNIIRTPAPPPAAGEMRVPDRPSVYGRPAPEMRTPQPAPEGARAVPRAEPGPGGPAPAAPPSGGAQHAAPAAQPAGGAPSGGGHARAGGRGR